ncbi:GntR family transcriptional regulator [Tepidamorphus gemmatus]|uniref:GntR family transcriptional regulator n=2 Tax=Tepidamorphus gemmatus TaxID=747076 RepID=A0A4R3MIM8_9HYPH|nr:GntR family transcriptional regulator [Tepidamorphus gemmatus]
MITSRPRRRPAERDQMNETTHRPGALPFTNETVRTSHVPASARVYEEIRRRIVAIELPPDTTLSRGDLADAFGVSQSPVREAILRLEQDGLVVSFPQSRTVVTRIGIARIREEHFLRTAVERDVARRLAEIGDPATILKVKGLVKMQEALADDVEQVALFKQLDEAFHEALFEGVGQSNLHRHITARCGNLARLRSLDLPRREKLASVLAGHRAVVAAIEAGDPDAAASAMRHHLSGSIERLPQIVEANPDLFA